MIDPFTEAEPPRFAVYGADGSLRSVWPTFTLAQEETVFLNHNGGQGKPYRFELIHQEV